MKKRDRSHGWQHAKLSGHQNEDNITLMLQENKDLQHRVLSCANMQSERIVNIVDGGLNEKDVLSILGDKTKNKTDLKVLLSNNRTINISIKKSLAGQVYLISANRFISGFEKIYGQEIPLIVKRAIRLYWGEAEDVTNVINQFSVDTDAKILAYQKKKHRVVAETLERLDKTLSSELLLWFDNNMYNIIDFCFSRGLAQDETEKADIIWYKNTIGENDVDSMLWLPKIKDITFEKCYYGNRLGGTTIQLPFGFVQWHKECMQFHHKYEKVAKLFE